MAGAEGPKSASAGSAPAEVTVATTPEVAAVQTPSIPERRSQIREQLVSTAITPQERINLMEESDNLLIQEITANVTASVTRSVTGAMTRGMKNATKDLREQVGELKGQVSTQNRGMKKATTEITSLKDQVATQQQQIAAYEAQKRQVEEQEAKNKLHRTIKLVAGAIGFTTTFFTPVGGAIIIGAGIASLGAKYLEKKGNEKLQQYASQIGSHVERINRLREAAKRLRANDPNKTITEELIQNNIDSAQKIENKRKWVSRLTTAARVTSPALSGFAIGAGLGNLTQFVFEGAVNSAAATKAAGTGEMANTTSTTAMGGGTELGASKVGGLGSEVVGSGPDTLNLPGSAYHGTTLQHASPDNMLPGGLENPSNFYGGSEGMAGYKWQTGVDATGLTNEALFSGTNGAVAANGHQVMSVLKANPSLDFAGAYEQVMGESLNSVIQSNTVINAAAGVSPTGN